MLFRQKELSTALTQSWLQMSKRWYNKDLHYSYETSVTKMKLRAGLYGQDGIEFVTR